MFIETKSGLCTIRVHRPLLLYAFPAIAFCEFSVEIRSDNYNGNTSSDKPKEESRGFVSIYADFRIIVRASVCKSWEPVM